MQYNIELNFQGQPPKIIMVYDDNDRLQRPALFDYLGAKECCRVLSRLITASHFNGSNIVCAKTTE